MAGDWIKMTHALPEKPEVLAISRKTGLNRFDVVGRLFILWRWFDINSTDGNAVGVTSVTLEECLFGYSANAGFVEAVVSVKWLTETEAGLGVVKFDEHISESAKTRAQTAKRVAKSKSKGKNDENGNAKGNADSVTKTVPREDNREDNSNTPLTPQGGEDPPGEDPPAPKKARAAFSLQTFLAECKASGITPIPEDDPIFEYTKKTGIPDDFLHLQWREFLDRYRQPDAKRYKDWRAVFRKTVRGNWFRLWYVDGNGQYALTTQGMQAQKLHQQRAA
jgi:hypothetical protein